MLKRAKRYWIYIVAVVAGAALTPSAISAAAVERGYSGAFGGEYLIVPLFLLITALGDGLVRTAAELWMEVKDDELTSKDQANPEGF